MGTSRGEIMSNPDEPTPSLVGAEKSRPLVFEEYIAVMEDASSTSSRRQTTNDVFVGINVIFLTALGILLISSSGDTWWLTIEVGFLAASILPLNIFWLAALRNYRNLLGIRYQYLLEIELNNPALFHGFKVGDSGGLHMQLSRLPGYRRGRRGYRTSRSAAIEIPLAVYFLLLYPMITLALALLTFLTGMGILPTLQFIRPFA